MFDSLLHHTIRAHLRIMHTLKRFHQDEEGAEFVEYIVVVGAMLALVAGLVWAFGGRVAELWSRAMSLLR